MATINLCRELISKQPGNYKRFDNYDTRRAAKREWGEHLEQFLRTRGGMTWNPVVAGRELDLYVLYHEVCRQGGVEAVIKGKRWKRVTMALELPPTCTNAAYTLRKNYYRWLYAFECHDVHKIALAKEEVEKLAQGFEPTDNFEDATIFNGWNAAALSQASAAALGQAPATTLTQAGANQADRLTSQQPPQMSALSTAMHSAAFPAAQAAPGALANAASTSPSVSAMMQAGRPVQSANVPVLPQQPKCNIAMLPLHPPISGMGARMQGMSSSSGIFQAQTSVCPKTGRRIYTPLGLAMPVTVQQAQSWPADAIQASAPSAVSAPVGTSDDARGFADGTGGNKSTPSAVGKKRDGEDAAADDAAKRQKVAEGGALGGTQPDGGGLETARTPQFMQQIEDEKLAAGLVQAAGNRAGMSYGTSYPPAPAHEAAAAAAAFSPNTTALRMSMTPKEKAVLADCRQQVLSRGGPDMDLGGWAYKTATITDSRGRIQLEDGVFINPQGYQMRSNAHVLRFFEIAGPQLKAAALSGNMTPKIAPMTDQEAAYVAFGFRENGTRGILPSLKEIEAGPPAEKPALTEDMLSDVKFPLRLDNDELVVEALGEVIFEYTSYHDNKYIFPVGYRAKRTCPNVAGHGKPQVYFCEVMHCGKQPLFRITPLNSTEGKHRTAANNPNIALQDLNPRLRKLWDGPAFFGLDRQEIRGLIERLPGAQNCKTYARWALGTKPLRAGPTQLAPFSVRLRRDLAPTPLLECLKLVKEIMGHRCAWPFLEPVQNAHRGLEDYGSRIRHPMDLGTVLNKLKNEQYRNPHLCRLDVIQVWRNCLYYSGEKDDATSMAREVGNVFDSLFADRILAQAMQQSVHPPAPPEALVGQMVSVFDSIEFTWNDGLIQEYDPTTKLHKVVVWDQLILSEQKVISRIIAKDSGVSALSPLSLKTAAHLPDLLPASAMMRINRREQEKQRQKNFPPLLRDAIQRHLDGLGWPGDVAMDVSKEWDTRWMSVPSVDAVLTSSTNLDGSRWSSDWPNKASIYYNKQLQQAASATPSIITASAPAIPMESAYRPWNSGSAPAGASATSTAASSLMATSTADASLRGFEAVSASSGPMSTGS